MRPGPRVTLAVFPLLALAAAANSHHAFDPLYDVNRTVSTRGIVTEFRLVNPHASMTLDSTDADGNSLTWTVDFDGRVNLIVGGWTEDTIRVGEAVTVTGNPAHTGEPKMFFVKLVRTDGSELLRPLLERFNLIDQQRRERN